MAPFYYYPGFNKPNGTGECIVSLKDWEALDAELKAIVAHACAVEANFALAEMERLNTEALVALTGQHRVQLRAWEGLDSELKAIVAHACATEASYALAEMERLNAEALAALIERHNVQLRVFPNDFVAAARKVSVDVLAELAGRSDAARKVHDSYAAFRERTAPWSRVSIKAVLEAREG